MSTLGSVATGKDEFLECSGSRAVVSLERGELVRPSSLEPPRVTRPLSMGSTTRTSRPQRRCQGSGTKKPHSMVRPHGIVWQVRPGLWHRSNRTALCVRTASCGRSYSVAASRQAHRTASWGGADPVTAAQLPTTRRRGADIPRSDAVGTDHKTRIRHLVRSLRHRRLLERRKFTRGREVCLNVILTTFWHEVSQTGQRSSRS